MISKIALLLYYIALHILFYKSITRSSSGQWQHLVSKPLPDLPLTIKIAHHGLGSIAIANWKFSNFEAALNQVVLHPVVEEPFKASFINLLWSCSCVLFEKADAQPLEKSLVTMLPVINLFATKMTALHCLLHFVVE